jgi:hypothetical protein
MYGLALCLPSVGQPQGLPVPHEIPKTLFIFSALSASLRFIIFSRVKVSCNLIRNQTTKSQNRNFRLVICTFICYKQIRSLA